MNGRQVREVELFAMLLAEQRAGKREQSPEDIDEALMAFAAAHNARIETKAKG